MTRKHIYLLFAVAGLLAPYYFLVSFAVAHGLNARLFFNQLFGTPISTFFAVDLVISCVVFILFLNQEAARHSMKHRWLYLIALCAVGLSFALPLFLWAREGYIENHQDG